MTPRTTEHLHPEREGIIITLDLMGRGGWRLIDESDDTAVDISEIVIDYCPFCGIELRSIE